MTEEHAKQLEALAELAADAGDHANFAGNSDSSRGFAIIGYLQVIASVATVWLRDYYERNDDPGSVTVRSPGPARPAGALQDHDPRI